jgi:hypothetical protein
MHSGAFLAVTACLVVKASANAFLGSHPNMNDRPVMKHEVDDALSLEIAFEKSSVDIKNIEEDLSPLFATLPKNEQGKLEPPVVRYALHRYFAQKYGWYLNGLHNAGEAWNSSSPTSIMNGQVPSYIESLFEQRLGHGLDLEGVAVFAATLAELIYKETVHDLEHIYEIEEIANSSTVTSKQLETIARRTLVARIDGVQDGGNTKSDYRKSERHLMENLFTWADIKMWAQDFLQAYEISDQSRRNPFKQGYDFDFVLEYMQEMSHKFGQIHDLECRAHKDQLVELEHKGSGRVRLGNFYSGLASSDTWPFSEKVSYLRALGALDETDPKQPSVIIPNYMNALSNCITPSGFYSVCCVDECEGLMAHVEKSLAEPTGKPSRIAEVVSNLASDTIDAPRNLSTVQLARLDEIAEHHNGEVPLHGRLFAQWIHHAFPRECSFPHVSGTTNPAIPEEWMENNGGIIFADDAEVKKYFISSIADGKGGEVESVALPWYPVEELVGSHMHVPASEPSPLRKSMRIFFLLAAVAAAVLPVIRSSKVLTTSQGDARFEKHLV